MTRVAINAKPTAAYDQRVPNPEIACHVFANGAWHGVSIEIAVTLAKGRTKRCEDCDGEVRIHREGKTIAHAEHIERHGGCPRSDVWRDGNTRPQHPHPIA